MGKYFDFNLPQSWSDLSPVGKAMGDIGDTIAKTKAEDRKLNIEKLNADTYASQVAATNRALDEKALRDKIEEAYKGEERRRATTNVVTGLLGKKRGGAAEAYAKSSQFLDPRTGKMAGMTFDLEKPGAEPTRQAPTPEEPSLPDFVQTMTPEQARTKAIHDSLVKQGRPVDQPPAANDLATEAAATEAEGLAQRVQDERQKYGAQKAAYEQETPDYEAKKKAWDQKKANPKVTLGFPGAGSVTLNPQEEADAHTLEVKDRAAKLFEDAAKEPDANTRIQMIRSANLLMDEIPAAEKGTINNTAAASEAQGATAARADKKNATDIEIANIRAKAKGKGGSFGPGNKAYDKEQAELASEINLFAKDKTLGGTKGLLEKQQALQEAYTQASKGDQNPGQQILILDRLLKSASGLGVRQQMLKTYLEHLGGLKARGQGVLQAWTDGAIGKEQWANVKAAIGEELSAAQAQGGAANKIWQDTLKASEVWQRHPDLVKRREIELFSGLHGFGQPAAAEAAGEPDSAPVAKAKNVAKGAKGAKGGPPPPPPEGKRIKLKSGETGTLSPDGTFHPDAK